MSSPTPFIRLGAASVAIALAAAALGCGGEDPTVGDEADVSEKVAMWGDDRVSEVLRGHPDLAPRNFGEYEKLFKVGRACPRKDSKEIFVVEEPSSRASGEQESTEDIMPRAVITGCNTDKSDPESVRTSFGLMAALVSSPDAPNAAKGDPMVLTPVEVMALDEKTGLYNFYVFHDEGAGKPATVERLMRDTDDNVLRFAMVQGKKATKSPSEERRCFSCHVNGGPIMNEVTEPWTNWVSTHKQLPVTKLTGQTLSIVKEAHDVKTGRSSFANDLEQTMRAAVRTWVLGSKEAPESGFGQMVLDGTQPGDAASLLRSVFCGTELNFASSFETVPFSLFMDPQALTGAGYLEPAADAANPIVLLPVRSEMDKRIEMFLQKKGFLSARTITAARLLDDTNDTLSPTRCGLYDGVVKGLPTDPAAVDAHIKKTLAAKVKGGAIKGLQTARKAYLLGLLDPKATDPSLAPLKTAYFTEAKARFDKATAELGTSAGRAKIKARLKAKQTAAQDMFPEDANPLPVLP